MSILEHPHARPRTLLFDWHATLADTMDAMYHAVDDVLPKLVELGLVERLVPTDKSRTLEDAKLVKYVRENARLHPKIKSDRKVSRTDIFEVLFGSDAEAKRKAHLEFDACYRNHLGEAKPLEKGIPEFLQRMRALGLNLGLISNRKREYMEVEVANVEGEDWTGLFDTMACGDEVEHRKPSPDLLFKALGDLDIKPDTGCWYVGDSTTDVVAAKQAGVTAIFYNGAGWDQNWIDKIFPDTVSHPHKPDAVVDNFLELEKLVQEFLAM
ncbi:MAG: HAD family hydrolase [Salinisphaeraceae bacterium]|nr:HAD family hydrolase [Salinisphaeraceae bacterium]